MTMRPTRRATLFGLAAAAVGGQSALALAAAATDRRLVVVNLRGAMDGLAAVAPYGDPALTDLRGDLTPPPPGEPDGLLDLGGFFGLHPGLPSLHAMYAANEMLVLHAVGGPTRDRSHFIAQDCLESGADHRLDSGWLNRVLAFLPAAADRPAGRAALAIGASVPLLLRGPAAVSNWAPSGYAPPRADLYDTILALNDGDPVTGPALRAGLDMRGFSREALGGTPRAGDRSAFPALCAAAGEMLAKPAGPRIAVLDLGGWDTHAAQIARMAPPLRQLDTGLLALRMALGDAWRRTAILVMTEFGRTARGNGTAGTDHGTASVTLLLGGAVAGGRVLADWPGLAEGNLFEGRDLAPTTDLRAVAAGLLAQHVGLSAAALRAVFPAAPPIAPIAGLIRAAG